MHRIVLSDSTRLDENVQSGLRLEKGAIENLNGVDGVAPESICKNPGLDDCQDYSENCQRSDLPDMPPSKL